MWDLKDKREELGQNEELKRSLRSDKRSRKTWTVVE